MLTNRKQSNKLLGMEKTKELFTVREVAKTLKLSRQAVDKRIRSRKVTFEVYGRTRLLHRNEVEKLLK